MRTFCAKKTCKRLQKSPFEIAVNAIKRLNHQGKTNDEAHRRLRIAVYESLSYCRARVGEKAAHRRQQREER